jgi:uncharacterized protein YceK
MKVLPIASLTLVLALAGCSSAETEISPQEKRNNFDACVIREFNDVDSLGWRDENTAEQLCRYLLE